MNKKFKILFSIVMTCAFTIGLCAPNALAEENKSSGPTRVSGSNRYETSVSIAESGWKNGAENVVIASGEDFADALCAAPLAKLKNAPILLTSKDKLNAKVKEEIKKLKAKKVIIIGGTGAVSDAIEQEVKGIDGVEGVKRIYGKDRYETSLKVAQELGQVEDVAVATGLDYADALSIAPIAAQKKMPIILVSKDKINDEVKDYVNQIKDLNKVYVVGGEGVVGKEVANALPKVVRLFGSNRYETNLKVINEFKDELKFDKVYAATAVGKNGFADALSGAVLASMTKSPLLLVGNSLSEETKTFIKEEFSTDTKTVILGGEGAVSDKIAEGIYDAVQDSKKSEDSTKSTSSSSKDSSGSSSGGSSGGSDDNEPEEKEMSVSVFVNGDEATFTIKNVKDSTLTIKVFNKDTDEQVLNYVLSGITDDEVNYTHSFKPGNYYFYVEGEESGKTDNKDFTIADKTKVEVTTSGKSFTLTVSNITDDALTITVYDENNESVYEEVVSSDQIQDGKYELTKELDEGSYYVVVEGENAGRIQTGVFSLKVVMTTEVTVDENNIVTLRVNNLIDKELTMILYDEKGNVVHAADFVKSNAITDEDLEKGYYEYSFGIDKGTYHGYVRGEKAGKAEINTFTVE